MKVKGKGKTLAEWQEAGESATMVLWMVFTSIIKPNLRFGN